MKKGTVLIAAGILVLISALGLTGYNLYTADTAYRDAASALDKLEDLIPDKELPIPSVDENSGAAGNDSDVGFVTDENGENDVPLENEVPPYVENPEIEMPIKTLDGQEYIGVLEISEISVKLPVISQMSYPKLKKAPCRYSGSAYTDDLVIGAHCYDKFFAKLKNVSNGAEVKFTDVEGNVFVYKVLFKETINEKNPKELKSGDWALSLFTCPVMTNTDKRIVLRCERIYP